MENNDGDNVSKHGEFLSRRFADAVASIEQSLINSFRSAALTPQETDECLQTLCNLMTIGEEDDAAPFEVLISKLDKRDLHKMASLLTSDSDHYFLEIARNYNGSTRFGNLLGKSDDADTLFFAAILCQFLHLMKDENASYVAIRGLRVFTQEKKIAMCGHILFHALDLACDGHGCDVLNGFITYTDQPFFRNQLLDIVSSNALWLSNHASISGNLVVQHALKLNDSRCTNNIAVSLQGHCVDLSYWKYGSYIVEKLLEKEESMDVVVMELLGCNGNKLMRLASHRFGNFVVAKALRVTQNEMNRAHQFWGLVHKLMPYFQFFRRSRISNIAAILGSVL
ncbi:hypothetical protein EUTSA_v10014036mg [Eutrema salsugineum]|uniref:PUM-HD domain-containing protein n=1 Tax=Eutrema salsugineum TaxID=72664 RepID=V4LF78_EUTSA|nr:pumilio homolog 18 [Eutrema salsugineum]ESQ42389.1 hypothetical protein EUTSA_v10014036mg [Eutrema salsugineum]